MQPLTPGAQLGPYRIDRLIGVGGMGSVYAASDTRLGRRVAIKISDERFGERFEREARAIASFSHPNICTLYDVGPDYLVMELVEGKTLAERMAGGKLAVEPALAIARQIAAALAAAHEKRIVHRDLKPTNIKITPDGTVKVLDFGIAKVTEPPVSGEATAVADLTHGAMLGTTAYMAPEQILGKPIDQRADIWAFGVVLYEMLAGRRPFGALADEETLGDVLGREPDWEPIPERVKPVLRRCLQRDARHRLHDINDFDLWLEDSASTPLRAPQRSARVILAGAVVAAAAAALALAAFTPWRPGESRDTVRMTVNLPSGISVPRGVGDGVSALALSPDGRTLVIAGTDDDGKRRLYARAIDQFETTPLAGTEGGSGPFFSPDGASVGFFADGRLKRVSIAGGAAVDITSAPEVPGGASWGSDDRIAFVSGARSPVQVVAASGGPAQTLVPLAADEVGQLRPELLPGGRVVLFESGPRIYALDLDGGVRSTVTEGTAAHYLPNGRLVFARDGTLLVAPFDEEQLALTGPATPALESIAVTGTLGATQYAVSPTGHLAYMPGVDGYEVVHRHADGREEVLTAVLPSIENPRFSPDGHELAVAEARRAGEPTDIWIHGLDDGAATRLTFDGGRAPVWTVDGTAVTFAHLGAAQGIYTKRADGSGEAELVLGIDEFHWLVGWSSDGSVLAFGRMERGNAASSIMSVANGQTQRIVGPGSVWGGRLSPDGRWLAYYILESGRFEIYVTPFPQGGARWLISDQGGTDPSWGPDGAEIYYRNADRLLAARLDMTAGIRVVARRVVVEPFAPPAFDDYHVHPDGRSLVMVRPVSQGREVRLVLDWLAELNDAPR